MALEERRLAFLYSALDVKKLPEKFYIQTNNQLKCYSSVKKSFKKIIKI